MRPHVENGAREFGGSDQNTIFSMKLRRFKSSLGDHCAHRRTAQARSISATCCHSLASDESERPRTRDAAGWIRLIHPSAFLRRLCGTHEWARESVDQGSHGRQSSPSFPTTRQQARIPMGNEKNCKTLMRGPLCLDWPCSHQPDAQVLMLRVLRIT